MENPREGSEKPRKGQGKWLRKCEGNGSCKATGKQLKGEERQWKLQAEHRQCRTPAESPSGHPPGPGTQEKRLIRKRLNSPRSTDEAAEKSATLPNRMRQRWIGECCRKQMRQRWKREYCRKGYETQTDPEGVTNRKRPNSSRYMNKAAKCSHRTLLKRTFPCGHGAFPVRPWGNGAMMAMGHSSYDGHGAMGHFLCGHGARFVSPAARLGGARGRWCPSASACGVSRRREFDQSAAHPSTFTRRFNSDGEGMSA